MLFPSALLLAALPLLASAAPALHARTEGKNKQNFNVGSNKFGGGKFGAGSKGGLAGGKGAGEDNKGAGGAAVSSAVSSSAVASASASVASSSVASTSTASAAASTSSASANSGDLQSSLTLDPSVLATGFEDDGQDVPEAGQVASLTSSDNFINFCATVPNLPITNGKQITTGSCNPAPMGIIPSSANIPSAKFVFPTNGDTSIAANTAFTVTMAISNMETGHFVNAASNYFAAPQQVNGAGQIQGHSHIVIETLTSLSQTTPLDPTKFAFFKGLNAAAVNGQLTADVTAGLPAGTYRIASINTAANHQPVLVPIAQHGSCDDMIYFTVGGSAAAGAGANNAGAGAAAVSSTDTAAAAASTASVSANSTASAVVSSVANSTETATASADVSSAIATGTAVVSGSSAVVTATASAVVSGSSSVASASAVVSGSSAVASATAAASSGKGASGKSSEKGAFGEGAFGQGKPSEGKGKFGRRASGARFLAADY